MSLIKKKNDKIRIIPLGGVGEIAKNMYIVEVDEEMFMLDAGLMFPEDEMLGVDVVIPDIQYVLENKDKLKGIFLSHGHERFNWCGKLYPRKIRCASIWVKIDYSFS